jgi:hypothetical protein
VPYFEATHDRSARRSTLNAMPDITPPTYDSDAYTCPHCLAFSKQEWYRVLGVAGPNGSQREFERSWVSVCDRCGNECFWFNEELVWPLTESAPMPNEDLPEDIKIDYKEARSIAGRSPRGAAALLRLCVQKLCVALGEPGKDLNTDIGRLVASRGLLPQVQQALDAVRVVGNNAVHPGEIDLKDTPEVAFALFGLVNAIADQLITHPKQVRMLYETLPETAIQAVERRDSNGTKAQP